MSKFTSYLMLISLIAAVVGFFKRNDFPESIPLAPSVREEPLQQAQNTMPTTLNYEGVNYTVKPQYTYDITGLVVSYRHHDGDKMLHKLWNDHLNTADLCVVWGDNAAMPYLNDFTFWNGQFTCNFKTGDNEAWRRFNLHQISNNHLISADPYIRKQIEKVKIGDQVRVKGWLSSYQGESSGERGTSTTRTDTGNGACETIWVESFEILVEGNHGWRTVFYGAMTLLALSIVGYFLSPYRPSP